jgi:hypothetical protein
LIGTVPIPLIGTVPIPLIAKTVLPSPRLCNAGPSKDAKSAAQSFPLRAVLDVASTVSFNVESYRSYHGDRENWAIMTRYQTQTFVASPKNLGQSDFQSVFSLIRTVDNLEKDSVNIIIIWVWTSVTEDDPGLEVETVKLLGVDELKEILVEAEITGW